MRTCTKCATEKPLTEFYSTKNGPRSNCKSCERSRSIAYQRTKEGVCHKIYNHQKGSSKKRGHVAPDYTFQQLREWLFLQPLFNELYSKWVESDFNRWTKPSCDRLDDYKGYTLNNLQLVTWKENNQREMENRLSGRNNKISREVLQMTLDGVPIISIYSMSEAARRVGGDVSNISACCRGVQQSAYGYKWQYANSEN